MSYHWSDNVHTTAFTPRDYQVELLASAYERNIIVCLCHKSSKEFIALKLIQELASELRKPNTKKLTIYICEDKESSPHDLIHHLTDLKVLTLISSPKDEGYKFADIWEYQVIICDDFNFSCFVHDGLKFEDINLIVIEDCHKYDLNPTAFLILPEVLKENYIKAKERPKILALAGPCHNARFNEIKFALKLLEDLTFCDLETTSDIVTVLRYCTKPIEYVVQCAPPNRDEFINFLEEIVQTRLAFLEDHRFDPSEIYSDEFLDELKAIPDPIKEPKQFLYNYIRILHEMGPWCADRAALNLLTQIEKQKVKTPYERHFLLLCLVSTTLVEIRAQSDYVFQKIDNEKERVEKYSTPKVLRLFEILRKFKPDDEKTSHDNLAKASDEIENLDFRKLQIELERTFQNIDDDENKNSVTEVVENLENILHSPNRNENKNSEEIEVKTNAIRKDSCESILKTRRTNGNRQKRKHFSQGGRNRHNNNNSADPDALYGIIFCNRKNTAKVLFDLLCEMSRHDPDLTFLNVQYTVDRVADPLTEPKEAELEHRRQEEVLKRFRMHECNLLIGTAVLEEGIDLPKCNLVIRWDRPESYRSYVQCKGRARAQQAYHVILVAAALNSPNALNGEDLSDKSHRYMCISSEHNEGNSSFSLESEEKSETDKLSSCTEMEKNGEDKIIEEDEIKETDEELNNSEIISKNSNMKNNGKVYFEVISVEEFLNSSRESSSVPKKPKGCVVKITEEAQHNDNIELINKIDSAVDDVIGTLAEYREVEKFLLLKCANGEPSEEDHQEADKYTNFIEPYKPIPELLTGAYVNLGTAIALINKYCAKLPSDTFTKLTPLWRCVKTIRNDNTLYLYSLRMPINSPLKHDIQGLPMPSKVLGRRMVALMACRELYKCGELDDNLQPIGKEGFKASEPDWEDFELEKLDEQIVNENSEPRPGTTKRRQYYYKRIASEFSECRPTAGSEAYLYIINMTLQCPIPEEQNTRGRRIYPPEEAYQGFGILTLKKIPKVSSFPIFTRSGEVKVSIELSKDKIILTDDQILRINAFVNYTFTNVLRLQKYLMLFDSEAMENCVYIVPTMKSDNNIFIDWEFLEQIYINSDKIPRPIPEDERKNIEFDPNKFKDAVVMPWYRNQDQPQYFYVAEICYHLTPESCFPGENYRTFQEYYFRKYGITIQNSKQPLLDVDHTSARLNFLTPRYVNRKGVALPTSSEETKRAKRENLEQKQILVPELCTIHPFPASLWRAAVCLPCILYRINGLLLADEIRKQVSYDIGLGKMEIGDNNFEWPTLHFGWSLAEVLKKSREAKQFTKCNSTENDKQHNKSKNHQGYDEQLGKDISDIKKREVDKECERLPDDSKDEKTANDLLEEADEKLKGDCLMEIGTWSNDMANNIGGGQDFHDNEDWGILPPNVNLCSRNNTNIRYGSPTSWDVGTTSRQRPIENFFTDSDASYQSDDDYDLISTESSDDQTGPFRIEFKSNNVAEAIDTEEEILKMQKQLSILENTAYNEREYQKSKNDISGYEFFTTGKELGKILNIHSCEYLKSVAKLKSEMINNNDMVVSYDKRFEINRKANLQVDSYKCDHNLFINFLHSIFGMPIEWIKKVEPDLNDDTCKFTIDHLQKLNAILTSTIGPEKYVIEGSGDIFDNFNDYTITTKGNTKEILIDFQNSNIIKELCKDNSIITENITDTSPNDFSFDYQPDLLGHPGPSPSIILQALTMSNANDGINLERLETIGDSFLKYAITTYLYCTYEDVHEGKLSHLRSKQVSNLNLYRLGRRKVLGECMIATKFEPHDNWLPPCYYVPKELEKALIEAKIPACHWNLADLPNIKDLSSEEICELVKKKAESLGLLDDDDYDDIIASTNIDIEVNENFPCFIPYNLVTQHSIPDKSVADCVEALIGAYLIECGSRGALLFMAWLGIRVLPIIKNQYNSEEPRLPGSTRPNDNNEIIIYGNWIAPKSPLLTFAPKPYEQLDKFLDGYSEFEKSIGYKFRDRSYLLQAMTHASYSPNRLTDCYQRLEFLGDAVLDYLITRHLYEDPRQHSPGALTDLRSALVNNTIFASLAVRHGFHKYFKHLSPGLNEVIDRFVRIQHENGHSISEEYYLLSEEECDDAEDVEVPKALGDVFESVAGAIFLDSNMSLDTVWKVYSNMMKPEIEQFSNSVPKSPIRELLELEPETAKFGKPEKLADGRRVRVTVDVFGKGTFRGIGRNYRIAKCTAAKCALRQLKKQGLISKKH